MYPQHCCLPRQQCCGYTSTIMNLIPEEGSTASETLVSNHLTTWHNNLENHNFHSPPWKPGIILRRESQPSSVITLTTAEINLHFEELSSQCWYLYEFCLKKLRADTETWECKYKVRFKHKHLPFCNRQLVDFTECINLLLLCVCVCVCVCAG
jgi:hypothetical protein